MAWAAALIVIMTHSTAAGKRTKTIAMSGLAVSDLLHCLTPQEMSNA